MCSTIKMKLLKKKNFENDMKSSKKNYAEFFWNSMLKFNVEI